MGIQLRVLCDNFPREDSSSEPINRNTNSNITSNISSTLPTVNHRHTVIKTLTSDTSSPPKTTESYTMTSNGFISAREKHEVSDMALSDYSFSFSLNRYSKIDGMRKALNPHACNARHANPPSWRYKYDPRSPRMCRWHPQRFAKLGKIFLEHKNLIQKRKRHPDPTDRNSCDCKLQCTSTLN